MKAQIFVLRDGSIASLYQADDGKWAYPVCGSVELAVAPYWDAGGSFETCSCGFEFGFDDEPAASPRAVESVQENWCLWRSRFLKRFAQQPRALAEVTERLREIGVNVGDSVGP